MSSIPRWISPWLPVILWMGMIFSASSDSGSFQHSSRIIGPLVHWLFPSASDETVHAVVVTVRKGAHLSEYAVLALLLWRALRAPHDQRPAGWSLPLAGRALLGAILYAATDEFHQCFVPSRQASLLDVLVDSLGAVLGLILLWAAGRWFKRW